MKKLFLILCVSIFCYTGTYAQQWEPVENTIYEVILNASVFKNNLFNVELEPVFVEYQTFLKYLKQGNFDLAVSAFLLNMDWNLKDILSSSGYFNYAGFADAKMDALLEAGLREMDEKKRRQIYLSTHECWLESLPLIPLFNLNYYMGISRFLKIPANRFRMIGSCGDFFYNLLGW